MNSSIFFKAFLIVCISVVALAGCDTGDTPTRTVNVNTRPAPNSMPGAIKSNPNIPPAAKKALLGNGAK